jgi:hypothetical protein
MKAGLPNQDPEQLPAEPLSLEETYLTLLQIITAMNDDEADPELFPDQVATREELLDNIKFGEPKKDTKGMLRLRVSLMKKMGEEGFSAEVLAAAESQYYINVRLLPSLNALRDDLVTGSSLFNAYDPPAFKAKVESIVRAQLSGTGGEDFSEDDVEALCALYANQNHFLRDEANLAMYLGDDDEVRAVQKKKILELLNWGCTVEDNIVELSPSNLENSFYQHLQEDQIVERSLEGLDAGFSKLIAEMAEKKEKESKHARYQRFLKKKGLTDDQEPAE